MPSLLIIEFLHRIKDVFISYFSVLSENSIKENFSTVYQILEEMLDNGFPLITEPNALMEMIAPPSALSRVKKAITGKSSMVSRTLPNGMLTQMPWRKANVKYTQNEIYFDVCEELDCIIARDGQMVTCDVFGSIECNCRLSGVPDLSLLMANPKCITDVSFHPCVRYNRYEREKVVSFVPPDGNFELMKYRVADIGNTENLESPIQCKPVITYDNTTGSGRINIMVKQMNSNSLKSTKGGKQPVLEEIEVIVPFSKAVHSIDVEANCGDVIFDEVTKICTWRVPKVPTNLQPMLHGRLLLVKGENPSGESTNVRLFFKLSDCTVSGIRIDTLNVSNEHYKPYKGVRALTQAGRFEVRV
eukprot:g2342.t1